MHKFSLIKQFDNKDIKHNFDTELCFFYIDLDHKNPFFKSISEKLVQYGAQNKEKVLLYK